MIAEWLKEEGRKEVRKEAQEATERIAESLLRNQFEPQVVAMNTGLSLDRCQEILARINRDEAS